MPINPWTDPPVAPEPEPSWEEYSKRDGQHPATYRLQVDGGWLYRIGKSDSMTFVPFYDEPRAF